MGPASIIGICAMREREGQREFSLIIINPTSYLPQLSICIIHLCFLLLFPHFNPDLAFNSYLTISSAHGFGAYYYEFTHLPPIVQVNPFPFWSNDVFIDKIYNNTRPDLNFLSQKRKISMRLNSCH